MSQEEKTNKLEDRKKIITSIKNRILTEYHKHKYAGIDTFAELAALKIYFTHIRPSNRSE